MARTKDPEEYLEKRTEKHRERAEGIQITFDHINIRRSISILLFKLVVVELVAAVLVVAFHGSMAAIETYQNAAEPIFSFNVYVFSVLVLIKMAVAAYVILDWLDEYYEISATDISHKSGTIWKRHERVKLEHISSLKLEQGVFGKLFNYGTIRLNDWFRKRDYYLYQIHNPGKYEKTLARLLPDADHIRKTIREHVIEEEED